MMKRYFSTVPIRELEKITAIAAVKSACRLCLSVQSSLLDDSKASIMEKMDDSPVTVGDFGVQALVIHALKQKFPQDKFVAEEEAKDLQGEGAQPLLDLVVQEVNKIVNLSETDILTAIDHGDHDPSQDKDKKRYWVLDPIDGTKGFLRKEQSAVALGLIEDGEVVFGVLGCPKLRVNMEDPSSPEGVVFVGGKDMGAFALPLDSDTAIPISVNNIHNCKEAIVTESVEAGHSNHSASNEIATLLNIQGTPIRMDSQAKYGTIARGDASIYLRLPRPGKPYTEKIWDHAAGVAVIEAAGGKVTDVTGKPLDFTIGRFLSNNSGVIATNGHLHEVVVKAVQQVLSKSNL